MAEEGASCSREDSRTRSQLWGAVQQIYCLLTLQPWGSLLPLEVSCLACIWGQVAGHEKATECYCHIPIRRSPALHTEAG